MDAKANILGSAGRVFSRHGYRRTSMAMVAEDAQLSRQAIYHHFPSKEDLFSGLVEYLQQAAFDSAVQVQTSGRHEDLAELLFRTLSAYHRSLVSSVEGSEYASELIDESAKHCADIVSAHARKFETLLKSLVRDALRREVFELRPDTSVDEFVNLLLVAAKGVKLANVNAGERAYDNSLKKMVGVICAGASSASVVARPTSTREMQKRRVAR